MKNNFSSFKRARLENKIAFKQQVFWEKKKEKKRRETIRRYCKERKYLTYFCSNFLANASNLLSSSLSGNLPSPSVSEIF